MTAHGAGAPALPAAALPTGDVQEGTGACRHCGAALESMHRRYCCEGCAMAAAIIEGAGLARYYEEREVAAPRPGAPARGFNAVEPERLPGGDCRMRLQMDGLSCASCVWVCESVLGATPGVVSASVSYGTGRAEIRWDPAQTDLDRICGRVSAIGYRPRLVEEAPRWDRGLLVRLGVAAFAAANMMMMAASVYLGWWSGMDPRYASLFGWGQLLLATPVAIWCAGPFYQGAWQGLRHGILHMDLPVSLGIGVMYAHGVWATLSREEGWLDSLGMLVAFLLAGRVLEQRGRAQAAAAAASLAAGLPREVRREEGAERMLRAVSPEDLRVGDRIVVASGEEIGADGRVLSGEGSVQMALLTGEAAPVRVRAGDRVVAGAPLVEGSLRVEVESVAAESLLRRMGAMLLEAGDRPVEPTLPDRIAPWFTAGTLLIAAGSLIGWQQAAGWPAAVHVTVSVLVVACPCALALAGPLTTAAGLGAAARRGLLLKDGAALRRLSSIRTVAFDKTGTLTGGDLQVEAATLEALRVAAALERESIHPIARAIVAEAAARGVPLAEAADVREIAGEGISGIVDGQRWSLQRGERAGEILLISQSSGVSIIRLRDRIRPDAVRTVARLKELGIAVWMLSGDHREVAEEIGRQAGLDGVAAELRPEQKVAWLRERGRQGPVLFVGDGINDGPALREASVGLAMARGAASSVMVADGVLAGEALGPILAGLQASQSSARALQGSLLRSVIYNMAVVAAAVAGVMNPLIAALLMPASSAMVLYSAGGVERAVARAGQTSRVDGENKE